MHLAERLLSCFIDEAGDFGSFESHSPRHAIHTAPLIRREGDYQFDDMERRRKLFNLIFRFARKCPIRFFTAQVKKSECADSDVLEAKITKEIKAQLEKCREQWHSFDKIIIYYDNGQKPLKRILNILFNAMFANVEVRKISPVDYKLFQVADLICTLEHIKAKIDIGQFSNSEREFFSSPHQFKKNYWRKLNAQRI